MQKKNLASIGLWLPLFTLSVIALLILMSFASCAISSIIRLDKLILMAIGLSPLLFIAGASVCIAAVAKQKNAKRAFVGIFLNIFLFVVLIYYFTAPLIAEMKV